MLFGEKILDYWDDIMKDLAALVAIPSVADPHGAEKDPAHPFGPEAARALDAVLAMAQGYGLKTVNADYYAGHAEYGEGEENAVVMAHVDVVPAGEGWETEPYAVTIEGNKAYGRGVADDKGAAVVALHCLRALKDAGVPAKRKLRVIFGSGEEIGMGDMAHYFAREQKPDMGFTPDASYGICNCEKGILNFRASGKNDSFISSFTAGTVANAVPSKAACSVICTPQEAAALSEAAKNSEIDVTVTPTDTGAQLLARGQAAHASTPFNGKNAAGYLVELLGEVFGQERLGSFFGFIREKIGTTWNGSKIGAACSDEPSGPLTFNLGIVTADEERCSLTVDIRYPATLSGSDIIPKLKEAVTSSGLEFTLLSDAAPLYLPRESKLISLLAGAYEDVTGEKCEIFSMGGGTYARQMFGKGVAFGPGFPDQEDNHEHDVGEQIELDRFKVHAQICLEAMYRMLTCD